MSHRRRSGERGQVLVLALAFIAAFALLVGAVLSFGGVTGLQHMHTEATAAKDGLAEGGAAYAAADAVRQDIPQLGCVKNNTGQLTMQGGDVAKYTVQDCNPGNSNLGTGSTGHCLLCILNETPIPPATSASPSTSVLSATKGITTTGGDDYISGSIASGTKLTANPTASASIRVWSSASTSGCTCAPLPVKTFPLEFKDPLAALAAPPSPVRGKPTGCASYDAAKGCSASFSGGSNTINPGLWNSLSVSGQASVTATTGVYVFTGGLSVSGQGAFTAHKVTIYLGCPNYGPGGNACPVSGTGGSINFSGKGAVSVTAPGSAQYTNVGGANGTLLGADVAILSDPNLVDPGGVQNCAPITGSSLSGCAYSVAGNGASVTGSVDLRGGGMSIAGNGGMTMTNGLLITNSLSITVSGSVSTGLNLTGPGTFAGPNSCGVFEDNVTGQLSGSASTSPGHAVIQSDCGNAGANGVVDFNYSP
jgi:hypothetical protein